MEKIYIDYDMTLVDTHCSALDLFYKLTGIKYKSIDIKTWTYIGDKHGKIYNNVWITDGMYEDVTPFDGAIEFVDELKLKYGKNNVIIITSSANHIQDEKSAHIEKYFDIPYLHAHDKWKYTMNGILIDDGPHNILDHVKHTKYLGILFNRFNRFGWTKIDDDNPLIKRAYSYDQILDILDEIKGSK